jgi:hypothetical protein
VQVARKPVAEKVAVAKVEPEAEIETTEPVVSENSSISTASGKVAEAKTMATPKPEKIAAVKEVGCKKFFPSVGMTLTVSCE